ncbi:unnamed protein product [Linum trigynum]|uniref:Disease resistance protein RGA3 n=1 Tax=Linum trigynum TaxID=586398 RepID=A0AAV2GHH9_9ROSI
MPLSLFSSGRNIILFGFVENLHGDAIFLGKLKSLLQIPCSPVFQRSKACEISVFLLLSLFHLAPLFFRFSLLLPWCNIILFGFVEISSGKFSKLPCISSVFFPPKEMAEIILGPLVELILGKLASYASDQVLLLWNLKPEIQKLGETVLAIQAVLLDAEKKQSHNHQVKLWLERISDIMYDADDLLDDFSTEAALQKQAATHRTEAGMAAACWITVCSPVSSLPKQLMYDFKMARDIKSIREKLDVISKEKEDFKLEVGTELVQALPSFRETNSCPPTIVIGREDDKKEIIARLLNRNPEANISVVPIVGMGGMGKTTLAQLVYDDKQVQKHFEIKAWVYVSQRFDVKMILKKMVESITRQKVGDLTFAVLQAQLREEIDGKRVLFVLDDAWEESTRIWEELGKYLIAGAIGSKVMVTTRSTRVAEFAGGALKSRTSSSSIVEPYYLLKGLSESESWQIMEEKDTLQILRQVPAEVQDIGKQILRQCGGVPLAVSTIAGVLADSTDPGIEWPSFLQKGLLSIMNEGEADSIMAATLRVSFNHLPSHMKHCFAYCGLFEKGFEFKIPMLVRLWVAQGYVESRDKGYNCFKTLWWRSFFQEVQMDGLGNFSTCRMHDLMHDLADSIAGENIKRSTSSGVLKNVPSKARHLYITEDDDDDNSRHEDHGGGEELGSMSKVRTLICVKPLSNEELEQIFNNFSRLRVLVICPYDENAYTALSIVGKLKHLRYLGMVDFNKMRHLPDSIVNLINLQDLNFFGVESLEELPRDIKKLVNLKHLDLERESWVNFTHIPKGIGKLKFLQTLPFFVVGKRSSCSGNDEMAGAGLDELKGLNALCGELTIKGLGSVHSPKKGVYVLKEKLHLQSLVLDWSRDGDDVSPLSTRDEGILEMLWPHPNLKKLKINGDEGYEGVKLPNWLCSLTNLVEFSLYRCLRCEHLPAQLHQMRSLKKLEIEDCPMLKGINNDADHRDSSLENAATRLREEEEWPQFRCLAADLRIRACPMLTRLPTFPAIEGELSLQTASLAPLARTMNMKMRRGGVDTAVHPLSKLTKLTLEGIDDDLESLSHPDSSSCLVSLRVLNVTTIYRVMKLPVSLCSSTHLMEIRLHYCAMMEYLPPLHELPRLRELEIWNCPKLKGCWWKKVKGNNDHHGGSDDYYNFDPQMERKEEPKEDEETGEQYWPHFPCLSTLGIFECPKLTRVPLFPTVEGRLMIGKCAEALARTMEMKPVAAPHHPHLDSQHNSSSSSSSSSSLLLGTELVAPLSKVTQLFLVGMNELESLPEEGIRNLTSLQRLTIDMCPRLASLPRAMQELATLQTLDVKDCPLLTVSCRRGEGKDWPNISHIPRIGLDGELLQDLVEAKLVDY